ncbi:MAG: hypothetical protein HS100_04225 [Anaerolineales bacterium]|nr:hypothetical protein [Anaerolineales bacterium]
MKQEDSIFQLGEADEKVVRTYECTRLRRFLAPVTTGFLTITNKRVIFHSSGRSLIGKSLLINEMPLEDTAGVRAYLEVTINWLYFAILFAIVFAIMTFLSFRVPFLIHPIFAILLMLPFSTIWVFTTNILNEKTKNQIFNSVDEALQNKVRTSEILPVLAPLMRAPFIVGCAILGWNIAFSELFQRFSPLNYLVLLAIYLGIYLYLFGQQRTFSLTIGSKTMKGSGIFIPGTSFLTILTRDTTAPDTLGASPAKDAEQVTRELGALLIDIRQLGDLGIKKWANSG